MLYLAIVILISMSISAMCSLSEACLLSISHGDIADMTSRKPKLAAVWKIFKGNIQKPIAVILIINTIAHTTGASLSGAKYNEVFGPRWIALFSFIFSFVMIQWTEILPKTIGVKYNKKIAVIMTIPLLYLIKLFSPLIKLIQILNLPFVGKTNESNNYDAVREISVLSRFAFINNLISKDQEQIISRTIGLTKIKVKDLMIPINEIKMLHDEMSMMEALIEAHIHNHTRYPFVSKSNPNDVRGYINFKDIVSALQINPENPSLRGIARPIMTFSENDNFSVLFKKLTYNHQHIAIVKDIKGDVTGLITLEDVIEEVIGEIEDEYDVLPAYLYAITSSRYIAGGGITIGQLNERLSVNLSDSNLSINDWIKMNYGEGQKTGNKYEYNNIQFIVRKISRSKINQIIIEKLP